MNRAAASPLVCPCDQAIFTSIHSGTGEGYRIIAASPGVCPQERMEITQRCPSHGGLCDESPRAVGLLVYRLATGRHCVAWCGHAGCEHTGRGGQRVYTHVVLLDGADHRRCGGNPVAVHAALGRHVASTGPVLRSSGRLEKLDLALSPLTASIAPADGGDALDWALLAAADLLASRGLLLQGAAQPLWLLERALLSLPLCVRETIDASAGLHYSPSRRMRFVVLAAEGGRTPRRIADPDLLVRQVGPTPPAIEGRFEVWLRLLRRWWRQARRGDIEHLTTRLCADLEGDALARVARICEDADAVDRLTPGELEQLAVRYQEVRPASPPEQTLIRQIQRHIKQRLAQPESVALS